MAVREISLIFFDRYIAILITIMQWARAGCVSSFSLDTKWFYALTGDDCMEVVNGHSDQKSGNYRYRIHILMKNGKIKL